MFGLVLSVLLRIKVPSPAALVPDQVQGLVMMSHHPPEVFFLGEKCLIRAATSTGCHKSQKAVREVWVPLGALTGRWCRAELPLAASEPALLCLQRAVCRSMAVTSHSSTGWPQTFHQIHSFNVNLTFFNLVWCLPPLCLQTSQAWGLPCGTGLQGLHPPPVLVCLFSL